MRALVVAVGLLCASCGSKSQPAKATLSSTWSAPTMLAKVPADSPYLIAILDPMPALVRQQSSAALDKRIADAIAERELAGDIDPAQLSAKERLLYAFLDELEGKNLEHWGRELGFDPSGRFVLYGLSVWPVLRIAVADQKRMHGVIARILAKSGSPAREHVLQGHAYWQLGDAKVSVIGSVLEREVVVAVLPTPALAQYLPILLGLQQPPRTLHDSNKLSALIGRYKLLPTMIGYLDAKIAADILTQRASSSNSELDRPLRDALGPIDQSCRNDLDRLVALMPRILMGYRRLDTKVMHGTMVIEMPAAITAKLQRLRTSVPDLTVGLTARSLIRFGVAAKLDELLPLLRQLSDHVEMQPFACSWFEPLNRATAQLADLLDKPLPAPLFGFRGFSFVLDDLTREPMLPRGHAVIVGDHANDLLNLLLRLLPGTSGVAVYPDARPVQLPLTGLGAPPSVTAYAATRVDRASIAVGPNSAAEVVTSLKASPPARSPLMSVSFDMQRMIELELVKPEDANGLRDVAMQLDIAREGLLLEVFGTYPGL